MSELTYYDLEKYHISNIKRDMLSDQLSNVVLIIDIPFLLIFRDISFKAMLDLILIDSAD